MLCDLFVIFLALNLVPIIYTAITTTITGPKYAVLGSINNVLKCSILTNKGEKPVWYKNNKRISEQSGYQIYNEGNSEVVNSTLVIERATLDKTGEYKCQPDTESKLFFQVVRFDSDSEVTMKYRPGPMADLEDVTITCKADVHSPSGQKLQFSWKFSNLSTITNQTNPRYIIKDENALLIKKPTVKDCGNFVCSSINPDINSLQYIVALKAPVRVKPLNEQGSLSIVEGDTLKIKCEVLSCPAPIVQWFRKREGKDSDFVPIHSNVEELKGRVAFDRDMPEDLANSTLKIRNVGYADKGIYMCKAHNAKSFHNQTITVRIKDKLAAVWPFLGICLEVALLCAIIFIYEKRRSKKNAAKLATSMNTTNNNASTITYTANNTRPRIDPTVNTIEQTPIPRTANTALINNNDTNLKPILDTEVQIRK